jgi:hypothetical protein
VHPNAESVRSHPKAEAMRLFKQQKNVQQLVKPVPRNVKNTQIWHVAINALQLAMSVQKSAEVWRLG